MNRPAATTSVKADDFLCRCTPSETERCDAIRQEVKHRLGSTDERLISHIVSSLDCDYDVSIVEINSDMWFGMKAVRADEAKTQCYIQCDRIEDGFVAIWKYYADNFKSINDED